MDAQTLLDLYDREIRIEIVDPGLEKQTLPGLTRMIRPAPGMNFISYSRLEPERLDKVIQDQIDFFLQYDQPFTWRVFDHDLPPELPEKLIAHGFEPDDEPDAILALDLLGRDHSFSVPGNVDVRQLSEVSQLDDVVQVEQQVLGGDFNWLKQRLAVYLNTPDYLSVYVAYRAELPVSTGWVFFYPGSQFAGLFGGSTLAQYRGQGLYSAVLAARAQEALNRGRRFLVTGASDMSRPILLRRGFRQITKERDYVYRKD